ncbi:MAG: phenylalanine--tRNA ligase beta subunit-related protein [Acidobacteriota bacterium]|nr:phenylalanine--tRNA ligase beta subunit-related protein [Acidobacteriota bacterium]
MSTHDAPQILDPRKDLDLQLPGWELFWARLEAEEENEEARNAMHRKVAEEARERWSGVPVAKDPVVAAVRKRFREAGCDPTRYRPSSEALLRRLLKDEELPRIHPLVDVNNFLSVRLMVPCCVLAEGSFTPPLTLRAGAEDESMESLRGPFSLGGKPLLEDAEGPFGTPITDGVRVKVLRSTAAVWLVAYLPEDLLVPEQAAAELDAILRHAPLARRTH